MKSTARMGVALIIFLVGSLTSSVVARQQSSNQSEPLVRRSDVYCTGFIADASPRVDLQVVGAEKENLKVTFAQGDVVFLNRGRGAGVQPGAVYYIIRPVGEVNHPFTKNKLGYYVRARPASSYGSWRPGIHRRDNRVLRHSGIRRSA